MRRILPTWPKAAAILLLVAVQARGDEQAPDQLAIEVQPLAAQSQRVAQSLELLGAPLAKSQQEALDNAAKLTDARQASQEIQAVLDPLCLAIVDINAESRVTAAPGPAPARLIQAGWRVFLVKVRNEAGVTAPLRIFSPNAAPVYEKGTDSSEPKSKLSRTEIANRWLDLTTYDGQPLSKTLSGLGLEYRVVSLLSRDAGKREAKLMFDVGQGTQDLGFRNELALLFDCEPAVEVELEIQDFDGKPTICELVFQDAQNRVYPSLTRRLAPDFAFHKQVYRRSGESILLPPGQYEVSYRRGPEYRELHRTIEVPAVAKHKASFQLRRWINLAELGWYSGDHHVHAAGCKHYEAPSQGVAPEDMLRHIEGEDLNVGCVLAWGPCWYFQKNFFEGRVSRLSTPEHLMRYDVEVSGFPSSHAGHVCLLRLTEDDYPGTKRIEDWPSWDLPVLKWARSQGAVVGFAHSGWGLQVPGTRLPSFDMPKFDGIGANEYIVDVTHDACDFISAVDTPIIWELSIWYHTLNCGYAAHISGETDFPCVYGERVGLGRSYVKLPAGQPLDYDRWVAGIKDGRSYVSDGTSHLVNFAVGGLEVGEKGADGRASVLQVRSGEPLEVRVDAAGLLADGPRDDIRSKRLDEKPYWHIERARIGNSDQVPVELVVNGKAVESQPLKADGTIQSLKFAFTPKESSWVAVRIFASSHTNPVFVEVDNRPIRASRKSAQWCLSAVDVCWQQKVKLTRPDEQPAAAAAYEHARQAYAKILAEASADQD